MHISVLNYALTCLTIFKCSRADPFGISLNVVTVFQGETEWSFPNFITYSQRINSTFIVKALRYRVPVSAPGWVISQSASDTGGLFKSLPKIDPIRLSLNFSLVPVRNGFVRFAVMSLNTSIMPQNFSILVKEVNQPPSFVFNPRYKVPIRIAVGSQLVFSDLFMNISKGGLGEEGQELFFSWKQAAPDQAILQKMDFTFSLDITNASVLMMAASDAWGNGTFNVILHDSQGATFSRSIWVQTYLQDLSLFLNFAFDLPCDIEKDTSVCRQDIYVLANEQCDGFYNWSSSIARKRWNIYTLLSQVASFPSNVLICNSSAQLPGGAYKLRNFVSSKAGNLAVLPAQPFTFTVTQLQNSSRLNDSGIGLSTNSAQFQSYASNSTYFDEFPAISRDGTLTFKISGTAPNQAVLLNITAQTHGADPYTFVLKFRIWQSRFQLHTTVAAFEDSGLNVANGTASSLISGQACWVIPDMAGRRFYSAALRSGVPVCDDDLGCRCQQIDGQNTRFRVDPDRAEALSSASMDLYGAFSFQAAGSWFGSVNVSITLWSMILPETKVLVLSILHSDDAPACRASNITVDQTKRCTNLAPSEITAAATACRFHILGVFTDISAGGPHEVCSNCPATERCTGNKSCQEQALSFLVDSVSDPELFSALPIPLLDGSLTFALWPGSRGQVTVYLRLLDDGSRSFFSDSYASIVNPGNVTTEGFPNTSMAGTNLSSPFAATIVIQGGDESPNFVLSRQVDCTANLSLPCTCPSDAAALLQSPSCNIAATPGVRVLENSERHLIESFVTDISTGRSVANGMTTFVLGQNGAVMNVSQRRREPLAGWPDLSLATSFALSPDLKHVYASEFESNTLAILQRNGSDFNLTLRARRADGESRFRFLPFSEFDTQNPCHAEPILNASDFGANISVFALMQGCDALSNNYGFLPSQFEGDALNVGDTGADPFSAYTRAFWNFDSYSATGELSIPAPNLLCTEGSSGRCPDDQDTYISPSGFLDSAGRFPAATMLFVPPEINAGTSPGQCKVRPSATVLETYVPLFQDAPLTRQPSVLTYLANNGEYEAFQFDRRNSGGKSPA